MTLGPLMLDLDGVELSTTERELLADPRVGGVILFSRNYHSPEQLTRLCEEIHAIRSPQLLIAVDQEGGRVQRFREGFTELPAMARFGELFDHAPKQVHRETESSGWLMAVELLSCGVDFSFSPVLDLSHGVSGVIGNRAFHRKPEVVSMLAQSWMRGMHQAGMGAVGKHFPGHGGVTADSHVDVPVDERPYADLQIDDLVPFERMISYGLEGIMPAHVYYRAIDPDYPAGFSRFWLQEVLRGRLGFNGTIFSDDLTMVGAGKVGGVQQRAEAALEAGCDMVLVCNHREQAIEVLDALPNHANPLGTARLMRLHGRPTMDRATLMQSQQWQQAVERVQRLDEIHTAEMEL
ncbi:MAG: beta-N-acetylhexosaminidase [Gammaproteobacteria bacterium]|jgi:beta-N-acetylhexosaminidase|nr:beta-N-acetylhexosaminidase [Gammaproteobacteria bacterium]MBT7308535.1 beta-N-acetylhexosaminidase [Gammaproteobacteria bacterium]